MQNEYSVQITKIFTSFYIGTFAIQTDHSVDKELERHVSGLMTWWKYAVNIAWLGFADAHCNIMNYFVNIGSAYMGADLNAVSKLFIH